MHDKLIITIDFKKKLILTLYTRVYIKNNKHGNIKDLF